MDKKLKVISETKAKGRTIFDVPDGPAFKGPEPDKYLCGSCGIVVAEGMGGGFALSNIVIRCYECRAFNDA